MSINDKLLTQCKNLNVDKLDFGYNMESTFSFKVSFVNI